MLKLFKKEFSQFFASITGILAIVVFLVAMSLVVFVFPESNVFDYGYASLHPLFEMAPWVLLFLIPAITMRMLAEEYQNGTMEFLLSQPITVPGIVLGKYAAALAILLLALLPTAIYAFSLSALAEPAGNIDKAAIIASYFGLFLLGASFAAIGLFATAVSKNQIVAFMLAVFFCFIMYYALESMSKLPFLVGNADYTIQNLSLQSHYNAMSRGVIDLGDVLYFVSIIIFFLFLTINVIQWKRK